METMKAPETAPETAPAAPWKASETGPLVGRRAGRYDQYGLTDRMRQMLELAYHGRTNAQIAARLGIALPTVKNTLSTVYDRVGLTGRLSAMVWWHEARLLDRDP